MSRWEIVWFCGDMAFRFVTGVLAGMWVAGIAHRRRQTDQIAFWKQAYLEQLHKESGRVIPIRPGKQWRS